MKLKKVQVKRIFSWLLIGVMTVGTITMPNVKEVQAASTVKILDASKLPAVTISNNQIFGDFTIAATASKTVVIDGSQKKIDEETITQRIKLGGSGTADFRSIHFKTNGKATIAVYAMSSSSSVDRDLGLYKVDGTLIDSSTAPATVKDNILVKATLEINEAGDYYLSPTDSGVNIYKLVLEEEGEVIPEEPEEIIIPAPVLTLTETQTTLDVSLDTTDLSEADSVYYWVYYKDSASNIESGTKVKVEKSSLKDSEKFESLNVNTTYHFLAYAVGLNDNVSEVSNTVSGKLLITIIPVAPTDVAVTARTSAITKTSLTLDFKSTSNSGEVTYILKYGTTEDLSTGTEVVDITQNAYTIENLLEDTNYYFKVSATNTIGKTASDIVSAKTKPTVLETDHGLMESDEMPIGWKSMGVNSATGTTLYNPNTGEFTLTNTGGVITTSTTDAMEFAYMDIPVTVGSKKTIVARLSSKTSGSAGLTVRMPGATAADLTSTFVDGEGTYYMASMLTTDEGAYPATSYAGGKKVIVAPARRFDKYGANGTGGIINTDNEKPLYLKVILDRQSAKINAYAFVGFDDGNENIKWYATTGGTSIDKTMTDRYARIGLFSVNGTAVFDNVAVYDGADFETIETDCALQSMTETINPYTYAKHTGLKSLLSILAKVDGAIENVTAVGEKAEATISWAPVSNAQYYKVSYIDDNNKTYNYGMFTDKEVQENFKIVNGNYSFTAKELTNGLKYTFEVAAYTPARYSTATVEVTPQESVLVPTKPVIAAIVKNDEKIVISWNQSAGATTYTLKTGDTIIKENLDKYTLRAELELSYSDSEFTVIAANENGNSDPSSVAKALNVTVDTSEYFKVKLNWNPISGASYTVNNVSVTENSYTHETSQISENTYEVKAIATDFIAKTIVTATPKATNHIMNNLIVNDVSNKDNWSLKYDLNVGSVIFGDRPLFAIATIPDAYKASDWLSTSVDSKSKSIKGGDFIDFKNDFLATFEVTKDSDIYVAMDSRAVAMNNEEVLTAWLEGWDKKEEVFTDNGATTVTYEVFKKSFKAGETVNLGYNTSTGDASTVLYFAFGINQLVILDNPLVVSYTNKADYKMSGTVKAGAIVQIINNNTVLKEFTNVSTDTKFEEIVKLSEGENIIRVVAGNGGYNSVTKSEIILDTVIPVVNLDEIPAFSESPEYTLKGSVNEDVYLTIIHNTVLVADKVLVKKETAFSYDLVLNDGVNDIEVLAVDYAENKNTESKVTIAYAFSVKDVNFINKAGVAITELIAGSELIANVTLVNKTSSAKPVTLVIALYDENGGLISYSMSIENIEAVQDRIIGNEQTINTMFKLPENVTGCTVKAFVWDSVKASKALSEVFEIK